MIFLFSNFGDSRLSAALEADATVVRIPAQDAAKFPQPATEDQRFAAILSDGVNSPEVVWCSDNPLTGELTVERGKEFSVARRWLAGTNLVHTLTTASIEYFTTGGQIDWIEDLQGQIDELDVRIDELEDSFGGLQDDFTAVQAYWSVQYNDAYAAILVTQQGFADIDTAWASYQLTVNAALDDANANVSQALTAFADLESAWSSYQIDVNAALGEATADIQQTMTALADLESAQASVNLQLTANFEDASAQISAESLVRSEADEALAQQYTTLSASLGEANASILTESLTRASEDEALAQQITTLEATFDSELALAMANVNIELLTLSDADSALAQQIVEVQSQFQTELSNAEASFQQEITALTTADSALAQQLTELNASFETQLSQTEANFSSQVQVLADADSALAQQITDLNVSFQSGLNLAVADIEQSLTVLADTDSALAESITTLSVSVDDLEASVGVYASAIADLETGVESRYAVQLTAGGAFAGFELMAGENPAGETVSEIRFAVDQFIIEGVQPFEYDSGTGTLSVQNLEVDGAYIKTLSVDTIHIKNAAITNQITSYTAGTIALTGTTRVTLQQVIITTDGGRVELIANFHLFTENSSTYTVLIEILREPGPVTVYTVTLSSPIAGADFFGLQHINWVDTPSAGTYTYSLRVTLSRDDMTSESASNRYLSATEVKK